MAKCSFCENILKPGTGKMYVKKDGKIMHFCSSKCERNMLSLERKPLQTRWTLKFINEKKGKQKTQ